MNTDSTNGMMATFTYTNIVPQFSDLNQGSWRLAEIAIRELIKKQNCDADKTYLLTGTVPSQMYIGYDDYYIDIAENEIPKAVHPQFCNKKNPLCCTKYKVNVPAYMWTAGSCLDDVGNCRTFSVLAKNDGHENAVGFYTLATLEKFLSAKSLSLSTCWMNSKLDKNDIWNVVLRSEQIDQKLIEQSIFFNANVRLFPGCSKVNTDISEELIQYFKDKGWAHFLHSYIPAHVEKKRQQLVTDIENEKTGFLGQGNVLAVLDYIKKAVRELDSITESDLTVKPSSNCNYL